MGHRVHRRSGGALALACTLALSSGCAALGPSGLREGALAHVGGIEAATDADRREGDAIVHRHLERRASGSDDGLALPLARIAVGLAGVGLMVGGFAVAESAIGERDPDAEILGGAGMVGAGLALFGVAISFEF